MTIDVGIMLGSVPERAMATGGRRAIFVTASCVGKESHNS